MKLNTQANLSNSINRLANNNNPTDMHTGWLGNGQGVVVVPNSTNGTEVYVRIVGQSGIKIAFNSVVPNVDNLPVEIGYFPSNPIKLQIIRQVSYFPSLNINPVPSQNYHHRQHEYGGPDMVYISKRQYMPFRLNSYGFLVVVSPDYIYTNNQWNLFYPTGATDLSGLVPGSGSRYVLVSISQNGVDTDFSTGTVTMGTLYLTDIPPLPYGDAPVAALKLYSGQSGIYEYSDILDLRGNPFIGISGSYSGGGGGGSGSYTVADTSTIDMHLSGNQISGDVIPGGIVLDTLGTPTDNTALNASTSHHGLAPKGHSIESPVKFWREDWTLAVPSVTGSSGGGGFPVWNAIYPPASSNSLDDEFDTGILLTGTKWTVYEPGSPNQVLVLLEDDRGLSMMENNLDGTPAMCAIYQSAPTGSFSIWTKIEINGRNVDDSKGGIFLAPESLRSLNTSFLTGGKPCGFSTKTTPLDMRL